MTIDHSNSDQQFLIRTLKLAEKELIFYQEKNPQYIDTMLILGEIHQAIDCVQNLVKTNQKKGA